jgi:hypothetical protein
VLWCDLEWNHWIHIACNLQQFSHTCQIFELVCNLRRRMLDIANKRHCCYHLILEAPELDDIFLLIVNLLDENRQSSLKTSTNHHSCEITSRRSNTHPFCSPAFHRLLVE